MIFIHPEQHEYINVILENFSFPHKSHAKKTSLFAITTSNAVLKSQVGTKMGSTSKEGP